jgi:hypothetical protein
MSVAACLILRKRGSSALCLAAALLSASGACAADDGLGQLMHRLSERRGGKAQFVERQYLSMLKAPVEASGELYFEPPDHLEKRTQAPKPESVVIDKGMLTFERGARHRSVALASYPELGAFIESIRATLAGDRASLEALYRLELKESAPGWELALTPRDPRLAKLVRTIRILGHDDLIDSVEILRVDGDRSLMTISAPTVAR